MTVGKSLTVLHFFIQRPTTTTEIMSRRRDSGNVDAPGVEDLDDEGYWTLLARQHWSTLVDVRKAKQEIIKKDIWDRLEIENFEFRSLVILENLQFLEKSVSMAHNDKTSH